MLVKGYSMPSLPLSVFVIICITLLGFGSGEKRHLEPAVDQEYEHNR
jgi:hypothetical protein